MKEIWKDIEGYEGLYQISNLGNVRSLDRYIIRKDNIVQFKKGVDIVQILNNDGYPQFKLSKNGKNKTVRTHIIVARHFILNPDNKPEVNHKDYNRANSRADNLEWSTHQDNIKYSAKNGHYKKPYGKDNPNYGNTKLKDYYKDHPEEKMFFSRPGIQNGRATPIKMIDLDGNIKKFSYKGECIDYLISNKIFKARSDENLRIKINISINNNIYIDGYKFELA